LEVAACFVALLIVLAVVNLAVKKLLERDDEEVTMKESSMAVPVVAAFLETGWTIGASCAANAVPA